MSVKFQAMTKSMERLNNYTELHHDWQIGETSIRDLITRACNSGGFVGANSVNVHALETVDDTTVSFKATVRRTKDSMKIRGLINFHISVVDRAGPLATETNHDAEARATIYWDLDK